VNAGGPQTPAPAPAETAPAAAAGAVAPAGRRLTPKEAVDSTAIHEWGEGYFTIDDGGCVRVRPTGQDGVTIRLTDVVEELRRRGFRSPFLIRFPQILKHRVGRVHDAFAVAIKDFEYPKHYQGVLPVKVNQQRVVVEALVEESPRHRYGLEVGSKGELALALTMTLHQDALVVCNGFKDRDYIELALRALRAGVKILLISETIHEVREVVTLAREVGIQPMIGFRARLHAEGVGKWQDSGGSHAKFGLSTTELLEALEFLKEADLTNAVACLHFHIGSQVSDIRATKEAVKEATRLYCHLKRRAPSLSILDLGGGLGVDYDGTSSASDWSLNYTLEAYCRDVVYGVKVVCDQEHVDPPVLVTESGRAVLAYHAVTVVTPLKIIGRTGAAAPVVVGKDACYQVRELKSTLDELKPGNCRELINDARALHTELIGGFKLGFVSLEDRAAGESLYTDIGIKALEIWDRADASDDEIGALEEQTAPRFVCNFSIFQSVPDTWAFRQVFPVLPLTRLLEPPVTRATVGDITCDSDGRIDDFVGCAGLRKTLPLPTLNVDEPFHIGVFLVGAYQDTLGDFHNLFGAANEAAVVVDEGGVMNIVHQYRGTTVAEALEVFGYPQQLIRARFDERHGGDDSVEATRYRDCFMRVVSSGTYLKR
jgi:arginine decarboxylase